MDDNGPEETWILRESRCSDCDRDIAYGEWRTYLNNDKRYDKPICRSCAAKRLEDAIDTIPGSKKKYIKTMEDDKVRSCQVLLGLDRYGDVRCGVVTIR
jgi:hypothetical protein